MVFTCGYRSIIPQVKKPFAVVARTRGLRRAPRPAGALPPTHGPHPVPGEQHKPGSQHALHPELPPHSQPFEAPPAPPVHRSRNSLETERRWGQSQVPAGRAAARAHKLPACQRRQSGRWAPGCCPRSAGQSLCCTEWPVSRAASGYTGACWGPVTPKVPAPGRLPASG